MSDTPASKVAIVVGGGSGIGAACVREFAADRYRVVAMSLSGSARELAESLGGAGLDGSNTDPEALRVLVDLAVSRYGRIDAVVNGSGHAARGPLLEITDEQWQDGFELYLMNVVRMARLVTPHLIATGGGAIVNVSTAGALEPSPSFPVSATIRAALASFTKLFATEYGPQGVRMNNVLPGFTKDDRRPFPPSGPRVSPCAARRARPNWRA